MNMFQLAFVVGCLYIGGFVFALITMRRDEGMRDAFIFASLLTVTTVLVTALFVGAVAVYVWLGEMKP